MKNNKSLYFLIFFAALLLAYYVTLKSDAPNYELRLARHTAIINNNIEHPYKYRLLNPYMTQFYFTVLKLALPQKASFLIAYFVQNILVFWFLLFSVSKFFSVWFDSGGVLIGALLFAVIALLCMTGWDTLGDLTTAGIMALGFYFINTQKLNYIYLLLIVGAFNELQSILLILFWFFGERKIISSSKAWLRFVSFVITFGAIYALIFILRGTSPETDLNTWAERKDMLFNIHNPAFIIIWALAIGPLLVLALKDIKSKPEFLKRNLFTVLPLFYVAAFFVIARMNEIDKALTIFLILIPMAFYTLLPKYIKQTNL